MSESEGPAQKPEIIPLPTKDAAVASKRPKELPYFLILSQKKQQFFQAYDEQRRNDRIQRIKAIQNKRNSKVLVYYSVSILDFKDVKVLLEILQSLGKQTNLDLFLLSPGGYVDPAFKMAKLCRDFSENFSVIIPYYAKSAATLLSLGANELVMGHPSEIDR